MGLRLKKSCFTVTSADPRRLRLIEIRPGPAALIRHGSQADYAHRYSGLRRVQNRGGQINESDAEGTAARHKAISPDSNRHLFIFLARDQIADAVMELGGAGERKSDLLGRTVEL
jgi:hypothetical protein